MNYTLILFIGSIHELTLLHFMEGAHVMHDGCLLYIDGHGGFGLLYMPCSLICFLQPCGHMLGNG